MDDDEYLAWIDRELTGEGWITPRAFKHPDLGPVWIGGTAKKHIGRTPPARYIEEEALRNAHFVLLLREPVPACGNRAPDDQPRGRGAVLG